MTKITREISDMISKYLYTKYEGDRIHIMKAHSEIASFMNIYGKHISEVPPQKATPKYCFGEWCFSSVSRAKLFKSVYPEISEILTKRWGTKIEVLLCISTPGSPRNRGEEEQDKVIYSKIYTREFDEIMYPREPDDMFDTWLSRTSKTVFDECVKNEWAQMVYYFTGMSEDEIYDKYEVGICEFGEGDGFENGIKIISTSDDGEIKNGVMAYPSYKRVGKMRGTPLYEAIL